MTAMIPAAINGAIFLITFVIVAMIFRKEGKWDPDRVRKAFRFFTVQSNVLCAAAALATCIGQLAGEVPQWVWILKYVGTAAVTVTLLTVFLFLAPSMGGLWKLLEGSSFFMHFLTPVLALVSFCVFERRDMPFGTALAGMLPVILYGALYMYRITYAPEGKRWDDFYGFNKGGKWRIAAAAMLAGTFLICMGLMAVQNL